MTDLEKIQLRFTGAVEIIATATVLHEGWEMDNKAWAVKMQDGSIQIVSTSHNCVCGMSREDAQEAIDECKSSIAGLEKILSVAD